MQVTAIETLVCDAGWRNYHFVKLTTDSGIVGWSEFDEGFGSPGVAAAIGRLAARVVGQAADNHERIYAELYCATRPAAGGVVAQAMGAIENALLDAKAKALGVPCYQLLGGKMRDRIPVYWSHCATWRINHPAYYKPAITSPAIDRDTLAILSELERKVLWLSSYMIHHANHEIDRGDGIKVGGHQASCASIATIMTALYFHTLRPEDRVAVKPHASPVFHAIQYLLENQSLDKLKTFRGFGGAQSYPSRTKDKDDVDFSTGSVGLGIAETGFASLVQDYVHAKGWSPNWAKGRMIGIMGDAEIDEGNVHEALLEYWKHGLKNCWWVIDYNRQSLDSVVSDRLFMKMAALFENLGWKVVLIKYGKLLQAAFAEPGGQRLKEWIDDCPNMLYSALVFQGGAAWRRQLEEDLAIHPDTLDIVRRHDDAELARLMTDAAGLAQGARREVEMLLKAQGERVLHTMDVVSRDEFEAVKAMAAKAREENERLEARIVALEALVPKPQV